MGIKLTVADRDQIDKAVRGHIDSDPTGWATALDMLATMLDAREATPEVRQGIMDRLRTLDPDAGVAIYGYTSTCVLTLKQSPTTIMRNTADHGFGSVGIALILMAYAPDPGDPTVDIIATLIEAGDYGGRTVAGAYGTGLWWLCEGTADGLRALAQYAREVTAARN